MSLWKGGPWASQQSPGADGREVELQATGTHLQWRYAGAGTWTDLVPLEEITGQPGPRGEEGPPGEDGAPGADGEDGAPGKDAPTGVPYVAVTGDKTLATSDRDTEQQVEAAATIMVPAGVFARGDKIAVLAVTGDPVTIAAAAGVTINGVDGGSADIANQYSGAVLSCVGTDAWVLNGDIGEVA